MSNGKTGRDKFNLTEGGILKKLLLVSLPIIGTQIIQMTYNLTDMFWLGRLGENSGAAVAASGSVGMYLWLSMAFSAFGARGAEIGVSQSLGRGDREEGRRIGQTAYTLAAVLGVIFALFLSLARFPLVSFLNIEGHVAQSARDYLVIVSLGVPFNFISAAAIGIFNGSGNSRTPFVINCISLGLNIVLDPILIFTFDMGIIGAAIATVFAQLISALLLSAALLWKKTRPLDGLRIFAKPVMEDLRRIFRWATPIALESLLFTMLSMLLTRMVNAYGTDVTAASRVGSQVESLSWLIGGGFASALTAFVGQNYGARKLDRIHKGFRVSSIAMAVWGVIVSLTLFFGGGALYRLFMPDSPAVVEIGIRYLRILSLCQFFQCLEGIAAGSFRGMGKTIYPSVVSVVSNLLRLIAAYVLSYTELGLYGIWWAVSMGAVLRGVWMYLWYVIKTKNMFKGQDASLQMQ